MPDLTQYLKLQSESLRIESESIKNAFNNTTNKGTGFEKILRDRIASFCPSDYRTTHGEIIDSYGNYTGQVDIAVVSSTHPRGKNDDAPEIILFDAIVAVGEAKLSLTTGECEKASAIAKRVAQFKLHDTNCNKLGNEITDKLLSPPFFLLTHNTNVALSTLETKLCNDLFHCAIVFNYNERSVVAFSDTVVSSHATDFLVKIGGILMEGTNRVYLVDNPLLALSWMLATFSVPMLPLSPIISMYY